jgi:hypothetical protein
MCLKWYVQKSESFYFQNILLTSFYVILIITKYSRLWSVSIILFYFIFMSIVQTVSRN